MYHHAFRNDRWIIEDVFVGARGLYFGSECEGLRELPFHDCQFGAISVEGSACNELLRRNVYPSVRNPCAKSDIDHYYLP